MHTVSLDSSSTFELYFQFITTFLIPVSNTIVLTRFIVEVWEITMAEAIQKCIVNLF